MKITPTQYAQALLEVGAEIDKETQKEVVANFFQLLLKNKHLKYLPAILEKLQEISERENKILKLEVVTAKKLTAPEQVANSLRRVLADYDLQVSYKTEPDIKGGLIIKYNNVVIDGSWKKKVALLKKVLFQ